LLTRKIWRPRERASIGDIKSGESCSEFRVICIENFIKEPPLDIDDVILNNLNDLYDTCLEANNLIKTTKKGEKSKRLDDSLKRIEELINTIIQKIGDNNG